MIQRRTVDPDLLAKRDSLLEAALPDIPFDGWTMAAMRSGAERAGMIEADIADLFPGGLPEIAAWFSNWGDRRMLEALQSVNLEEMKVRQRITTALNLRLELAYPYREAVGQALSVLSQPQNAPRALASLRATVDDVWHAAGDTATDINWYTKRALLGALYASILLYWLNDRSEHFEDTRSFIDRRIEDVMRLSMLTRPLSSGPLSGLFDRLRPFGRRQRMRV